MMFRAIICCAALIFGLLAALGATAQSAGAPPPLNLMSFMRGSAKAGPAGTASAKTASTTKHRHASTKTAARVYREVAAPVVVSSEPPVPQAAAATADALQSDVQPQSDVQVVSGDELNVIDLAMDSSAAETNGAASRTDGEARDRLKSADANEFLAEQYKPDSAAAPSNEVANAGSGIARDDGIARESGRESWRESWMTRFWSAIGDGFVALVGMVRSLFG